jgi:hypothetical protein
VWHELVAQGIGGRSVAEAKRRISHREFISWLKYRKKHGTFDMGYRIDRAAAIICSALAHGKVAPEKFMPRYEEDEVKESFNTVFAGLKSKAKPKKVK